MSTGTKLRLETLNGWLDQLYRRSKKKQKGGK